MLTITGSREQELVNAFEKIFHKFSVWQPDRREPMLNILAFYQAGEWVITLIPRKQHRPKQYFAGDNDKIIVSPASVDIGGVIITPREEDFNSLDEIAVSDIFEQVCYNENEVERLVR